MEEHVKPEFHFDQNTGDVNDAEPAGPPEAESTDSLKKNKPAAADKRYQINPGYVLRRIGGDYVIIPVGKECLFSNAVMTPNDSAVSVWNKFMNPCTEEDAVEKILEEYEGPVNQIRSDIHRFVKESLGCRVLREVD